MVANMRDVLGLHPGSRMLAIVGASHKGYYEAYLNQMHDVQLVSADAGPRCRYRHAQGDRRGFHPSRCRGNRASALPGAGRVHAARAAVRQL
ncbi:hypothetical protein G6F66_015533 [Rhizopus arrhizus]|nr:hypothetical protein G6F66_015533 [Rhizopus arrhizus]